MKFVIILLVNLMFSLTICWANDKPQLQDEKDKINYSVGYQIGGDFKRQGVELDAAALLQGIKDAVEGSAEPLMTADEMHTTLVKLKQKINKATLEQQKHQTLQDLEEGKKFLTENAKKEGVVTLPGGLQYKILREGTGVSPKENDTLTINYRGSLISGREFDSSYRNDKPATIAFKSIVIPGWQEALKMMKEGGKWQIFLPPHLAFGERGPLADKTLIYELELLSVTPADEKKNLL